MAQSRNDNIQVNAPKQLDNRSGVWDNGSWRPFNNIAEFNALQPVGLRFATQTFWVRDSTDANKSNLYGLRNNDLTPYLLFADVNLSDYYTKEEIDSKLGEILPYGLRGQTVSFDQDNKNLLSANDVIIQGIFVETQEELDAAKLIVVTQTEIFNKWKRYSVGGSPVNPSERLIDGKIPQRADQTNSWQYNSVNDRINSTFNTGSHIGFISNNKLTKYSHKATLLSTDSDDDNIGLLIAYVEDATDMVPNQAYGLDPTDFLWPIDVTSVNIPNQHTLTVMRNRGGIPGRYAVWYNYSKPDAKIISEIEIPGELSVGWLSSNVDLKVVRDGDLINITTTRFSNDPQGKGVLGFPIDINLSTDTDLLKFRGAASYGYCVHSQLNSSFRDIEISDNVNVIYDLRPENNGAVWVANSAGTYAIDPDRSLFIDVKPRSILWNPNTDKYFWLDSDYTPHWINKSVPLSFTNGLRESGGTVQLGLDLSTIGTTNKGILTSMLYLALGSFITENLSFLNISDEGAFLGSGSSNNNGSVLRTAKDGIFRLTSFSDDGAGGRLEQVLEIFEDESGDRYLIFRDDLNGVGAGDLDDYSANKKPYSYVTLKMLNAASGNKGSLSITDTNIKTNSNPERTVLLRFAHGLSAIPTTWQLNGINPVTQAILNSCTQTADATYINILPDYTNNEGQQIEIKWTANL